MRVLLLILLVGPACTTISANAQLLSDTLFTWQGYADDSVCRVRVYRSAEKMDKPYTVVVSEIAENRGRSTLEDARLVVELVARTSGLDPEQAYWVFHWGAFSHARDGPSGKEAFFRATFRRRDTGSLGSPSWRLLTRQMIEEYTDRAFDRAREINP